MESLWFTQWMLNGPSECTAFLVQQLNPIMLYVGLNDGIHGGKYLCPLKFGSLEY